MKKIERFTQGNGRNGDFLTGCSQMRKKEHVHMEQSNAQQQTFWADGGDVLRRCHCRQVIKAFRKQQLGIAGSNTLSSELR